MATGIEVLDKLADYCNGEIDSVSILPDGSGFATMSMPLPKGHWLLVEGFNDPPAPMRMGKDNPLREALAEALRLAGRYAVRCATMNGTLDDFDPDALIQNLEIGFFGYYTEDGLSHI